MKMKTYSTLLFSVNVYNLFGIKKKEVDIMLDLFILLVLVAPVAVVLAIANKSSKDYFDYDEKKCSYISRLTK
jgi:uncharacterized membrane protein